MTKNVGLFTDQFIDEYLLNSSTQDILIVPIYQDEIPFTQNIGLLDWRLYGLFSHLYKDKHLQGLPNECLLLPVQHHHGLRNILCVGMGKRSEKISTSTAVIKNISDKVQKLNIQKVYIMDTFFNEISESTKSEQMKNFSKHFKQETRWIVQ